MGASHVSTRSEALKSWKEEKQSVFLYRSMAEVEHGTPREKLFLALADAAERQAGVWENKLRGGPGFQPELRFRPGLRARGIVFLLPVLGPVRMRSILAAMKVRGLSVYDEQDTARHRLVAERHHRGHSTSGNLRAAIFGANDGLISNASLMLGVAGGVQRGRAPDPHAIVIAGVAGLLAGAFSMASGEFVSVRSQRELFEYQIGLERLELEQYPDEEAAELALIYETKGIPKEEARRLGTQMVSDPAHALDTLAREELGLNPQDLGSPIGAALASFFSFGTGAVVPLLPFLLLQVGEFPALRLSIALTGIMLFLIGLVLSLFTGRSAVFGGLRMLAVGAFSGGATWLIGSLLGVVLR